MADREIVIHQGRLYVSIGVLSLLGGIVAGLVVSQQKLGALESAQKETVQEQADLRKTLATKEELSLVRQDLRDYRAEVVRMSEANLNALTSILHR